MILQSQLRASILACGLVAALATGCNKAPEPAPAAEGEAAAEAAPAEEAAAAPAAESTDPNGPPSIALPEKFEEQVAAGDAKKGEELFASKGCKACHNADATKLVGPGMAGVTKRRSVQWVARMLLKPEVMIKEDAAAKKLFAEYMTPMANQNVDPTAELPHLVAYLKTL